MSDQRSHGELAIPFAAITGQTELKLALVLAGVQPHLGGVLITGHIDVTPGDTVRALAGILPPDAPFVEVPRSVSVDHLVGLLPRADGGVLFLDGITRFPQLIVEVILDAHHLGLTRVECDGRSQERPSRFVLVATTDEPISPRWAAHFGLSVDATDPSEAEERVEATRQRLASEHDPESFLAQWEPQQRRLRRRLEHARPAEVPDRLLTPIGSLITGLRAVAPSAGLVLARAAAALAGWEGRLVASESDLAAVAPMVLRHRGGAAAQGGGIEDGDADDTALIVASAAGLAATGGAAAPRFSRYSRSSVADPVPTRRTFASGRWLARSRRATNLIVACVDASGSDGAEHRVATASGALLHLLNAAPTGELDVALVTFGGDGAQQVLSPTSSLEAARSGLAEATVGGGSPLASGIQTALSVATLHSAGRSDDRALLVVLTDGRATVPLPDEPARGVPVPADDQRIELVHRPPLPGSAPAKDGPPPSDGPEPSTAPPPEERDPLADAQTAGDRVARRSIESVLVFTGHDSEREPMRSLALRMAATFLTLPELSAQSLAAAVGSLTAAVAPADADRT